METFVGKSEFERSVRESDLGALEKLILYTAAQYTDWKTGENMKASKKTLRRDSGIASDQTFYAHFAAVVEKGWLTPVRPGKNKTTIYRLSVPAGSTVAVARFYGSRSTGSTVAVDNLRALENLTSKSEVENPKPTLVDESTPLAESESPLPENLTPYRSGSTVAVERGQGATPSVEPMRLTERLLENASFRESIAASERAYPLVKDGKRFRVWKVRAGEQYWLREAYVEYAASPTPKWVEVRTDYLREHVNHVPSKYRALVLQD